MGGGVTYSINRSALQRGVRRARLLGPASATPSAQGCSSRRRWGAAGARRADRRPCGLGLDVPSPSSHWPSTPAAEIVATGSATGLVALDRGREPALLVSVLAQAGTRPGDALALEVRRLGPKNVGGSIVTGQKLDPKHDRTAAPRRQDLTEYLLASGRRAPKALLFPRPDSKPWRDTDHRNGRRRVSIPRQPQADSRRSSRVRPPSQLAGRAVDARRPPTTDCTPTTYVTRSRACCSATEG